MSYSDDDNERAMKAILKLADPPDGFKDITLDDAVNRLKKICDIADGGEIPSEADEDLEDE